MSLKLLITKLNFPARLYRNWLVKISLRLLRDLDSNMKKARYPRYKRRQFWRDFIKSSLHDLPVKKLVGKSIIIKRRNH